MIIVWPLGVCSWFYDGAVGYDLGAEVLDRAAFGGRGGWCVGWWFCVVGHGGRSLCVEFVDNETGVLGHYLYRGEVEIHILA